jgi:hypothetical protein
MNSIRIMKLMVIGSALLAPVLWSGQSLAGAVALTMQRATLTNVVDAAGTWQHEGGTLLKGTTTVGHYALHRRVTTGGTDAQNTAMETITLFLNGAVEPNPPHNATLQGAHNFNSGRFMGSVSAVYTGFQWLNGADAVIVPTATIGTSTLNMTWTGNPQLTVP